jgi:hypothetical protein
LVNGPKSEYGYLMYGNQYINLDNMLPNFYFEHVFMSPYNDMSPSGYLMNHREDVYLENGYRILKETYLEVESLDTYMNKSFVLDNQNIILD